MVDTDNVKEHVTSILRVEVSRPLSYFYTLKCVLWIVAYVI